MARRKRAKVDKDEPLPGQKAMCGWCITGYHERCPRVGIWYECQCECHSNRLES